MKKIFLMCICLLSISPMDASANNIVDNTFKIVSYEYDEFKKIYSEVQYGSSVYLGDDLIYTNAHVVLNEDDEPIGNYNVCKTVDVKDMPECFSPAKLEYYDLKNDLAVLRILTPNTSGLTLAEESAEIGDKVEVYGYPRNGGETITFTKGVISGFEDGLYKTDSDIDSGNSGGGVFDEEGDLIGISVSVVVGYDALGYVIPVSTLKDFIDKDNSVYIREYGKKISKSFATYITQENTVIKENVFELDSIKFAQSKSSYFDLNYVNISEDSKYFFSFSQGKKGETDLFLINLKVLGKEYTIEEFMEKDIEDEKKNREEEYYDDILTVTKIMQIRGREVYVSIELDEKTSAIFISMLIPYGNNSFYNVVISSDNKDNESLLKAISYFLNNIELKEDQEKYLEEKNKSFFSLKVNNTDDFYIMRSVTTDTLESVNSGIQVDGTKQKIKKSSYLYEEHDPKEFIKYVDDLADSYNEIIYHQNSKGTIYLGYKLDELYSDDYTYLYTVTFNDKLDGDKEEYYTYSIRFLYNTVEEKKIIDSFLDGIEISGEYPFDTEDIEFGKNYGTKEEKEEIGDESNL